MNDSISNITDDSFEKFIKKSKVLVDFWARWCAPCLVMAPILENLARKYPEIAFGKIDIDENKKVAYEKEIMSIPTLLFYKNGNEVERIVGAVQKERIEKILKNL